MNKYQRVLMTEAEYRKAERNKRWLRKAIIIIGLSPFIASAVAAAYMTWFRQMEFGDFTDGSFELSEFSAYEVLYMGSESLTFFVDHLLDSQVLCDPFDIISAMEDRIGQPLALIFKETPMQDHRQHRISGSFAQTQAAGIRASTAQAARHEVQKLISRTSQTALDAVTSNCPTVLNSFNSLGAST